MEKKETPVYYPASIRAWRKWLEKHHLTSEAVWVVFYTKSSGKKTISWSDAVSEALCYGWIDSKKIKIDEERSHQFFSRRKSKSTWSKINKEKVVRLQAEGRMSAAGLQAVELAKQNGSWNMLDEVEEVMIPADLESAFESVPGSKDFFLQLSRSVRKAILQWLVLARRPETRLMRITEIVTRAAQQQKPKHLQ